MAKVQLADLMNPLTKIEQSTRETANKLDALVDILTSNNTKPSGTKPVDTPHQKQLISTITGAASLAESLNRAILIELTNHGKQLSRMVLLSTSMFRLAYMNRKKESTTETDEGLLSSKKGKTKSKGGVKAGAEALLLLGVSAMQMAKALMVFTFVPKKSIIKFQSFIVDIFTKLDEFDQKKIKKGAENLILMGDSIMNFSKSLAISALLILPGLIAIPFLIVTIGIMSSVMYLIGTRSKQIGKGGKALEKVGDGLKSFGIGLAVFALTTLFIMMEPKILLGMVASLVLISGTVALIGLVSKQVKKGALALTLLGIGLASFGIGYAIFALAIHSADLKDGAVFDQVGVLLGLGLATALLGMAWSYIGLGALALGLMGIGLFVFGLGYTPFAEATKDIGETEVITQGAILLMLGLEFAAAGLGVAFIIPGAVAFATIGGALLLLAPGLDAIRKVAFTPTDSMNLTLALSGIKAAFLGTDSNATGVDGFFKNVGSALSSTVKGPMMISSAAGFAAAGMALSKLSVGLTSFTAVNWTPTNTIALTETLGVITSAFAHAGGEPSSPGGVFGAIFGSTFSPNATERGIDSVMSAGKALTNITKGLVDFNNFANSGVKFGKEDGSEPGTLAYNVTNTLGFIRTAFAAIGEGGATVESGGFFSSLLGIKSTAVEEGIRSVMDTGKALTGITTGLIEFQKLADSKIDIELLAPKIKTVISTVMSAFGALADDGTDVESGGFFSSLLGIKSTKTEEGIRSVKGAGDELTKIAASLSAFEGLKDPGGITLKIESALGLVMGAFSTIGGAKVEGWLGLKWDNDSVEEGIAAVKGAGEELTNIANGLLAFSNIKKPDKVAETIKTLLESMSGTFVLFYDKPTFSTRVNNFAGFVTSLAKVGADGSLMKAADGFEAIAEAINSVDIDKAAAFRGLFEASASLTESGRNLAALEAMVEAIEDVKDTLNSQGGGGAIDSIKTALGFGNAKEAVVEPSTTAEPSTAELFKTLQLTLNQINATLSNLPGDIAAIEIKLPRD